MAEMNKSLTTFKQLFESYLEEKKFRQQPNALYEPNNYLLSIGGKRLRPIMVLLGCELFSNDAKRALPGALAVEYFHNFTLMHDDIMDAASLRRGQATVHQKFGVNEAILSGDVLLIYAYHYIATFDAILQKRLIALFNKTAIEVCEGQSMDTTFEKKALVTEAEYIEMIRLKTAVLLAAALKMGALIGRASDEEADLLYEYGINLGIGFQIQDDILDTFGSDAVGKQIGGDIVQNKKTLLLIKALELSKANKDNTLQLIIENEKLDAADKIEQVKAIYEQYNVLGYATDLRTHYVQKSKKALQSIHQPHEILTAMADELIIRNH
jgi:geranylgeranyl diphosphate synthase type II